MAAPNVSVPEPLAFADRKVDGAYPVTTADGRLVARIGVSGWTRRTFAATDGVGTPLCTGGPRGFFSRDWDATTPTGAPLVSLRRAFFGTGKAVSLPDGRRWSLAGRLFTRDFAVVDEQGRTVIEAEPNVSAFSFHPDAFVVRVVTDRLSLAQLVALVELNRLIIKSSRSSGAAASAGSS